MKLVVATAAVVVVCAFGMPSSVFGTERPNQRTFVSPDKTFQFHYPASLILCEPDKSQESLWRPIDSCEGYIPVCYNSSRGKIIACVAYPAAEYRGTTFEAAAIAVSVWNATKRSACLSDRPSLTITGVPFDQGEGDSAGTGNYQSKAFYLTFHEGRCYELDVNISEVSSTDLYEPDEAPKEFSPTEARKVRKRLEQVLHSFRFLK